MFFFKHVDFNNVVVSHSFFLSLFLAMSSFFSCLEFSLFRDVLEVAPYYAVVDSKLSSIKQQSEKQLDPLFGP